MLHHVQIPIIPEPGSAEAEVSEPGPKAQEAMDKALKEAQERTRRQRRSGG